MDVEKFADFLNESFTFKTCFVMFFCHLNAHTYSQVAEHLLANQIISLLAKN